MSQSLDQLIASTNLMVDLHDIEQMSAEERARVRAKYQAQVTELAREEAQAIAHIQPPTIPALATMRALNRVVRKHRAGELALARVEQAIAQAEIPPRIDGLTF